MKVRRSGGVILSLNFLAVMLGLGVASGIDVPAQYLVDLKDLKSNAPPGTALTFQLYGDSGCTTATGTPVVVNVENVDLIEQVKPLRLAGGTKPPKLARLNHLLSGMPAESSYFLKVTASAGITPSGGSCQSQAQGSQPLVPEISARVVGTSDVTIPSDVWVTLGFDFERWDTANLHDPGNPSRLTAPVAGTYQIDCRGSWKTNGVGWRVLALRLNGVLDIAVDTRDGSSSRHTETASSTQFRLAAGDYVECVVTSLGVAVLAGLDPAEFAATQEFSMTRFAP
jgi:hypothetical protein